MANAINNDLNNTVQLYE